MTNGIITETLVSLSNAPFLKGEEVIQGAKVVLKKDFIKSTIHLPTDPTKSLCLKDSKI